MTLSGTLPTWAYIVQTLTEKPLGIKQLHDHGFNESDVLACEQSGHIKLVRHGARQTYETTFKGRKSYSVVKTDQIIAYSKAAEPSVAAPASGPPTERYESPAWETARPGALDAFNVPSRGLR